MSEEKKILLVEDEVYLRDVYFEMLKEAGYVVDTAENGEVALQKIESNAYDLVLLDVMLPGIDGYKVLQKAAHEGWSKKHKKFVLMTNLANDNLELPEGVHIDGTLIKANLNPGEFVEQVRIILRT